MKHTKIVSTLGPASESLEMITALIDAGVDVFRLNTKHGDLEWHSMMLKKIDGRVATLIDLQGPEIRINTRNAEPIQVFTGDTIVFGKDFDNERVKVSIDQKEVFGSLKKGDLVLIDDGLIEFEVVKTQRDSFTAKSHSDQIIKNRKGLNLPGKHIDMPSLVPSDLKMLTLLKEFHVDFVALSFCRSKKDIDKLRSEINKHGSKAQIVAKIESQQALDNLDEIILATDAVMVARGDLGIEVPFERLAKSQTHIVEKCRVAGKPVIVATQMLESMTVNPRPTRAEATDVANAVFDGTDAVMLSGETASGNYPVKAVEAMARIIKYNENSALPYNPELSPKSDTQLIIDAAMNIVKKEHGPDIDVILIFTESGYTARMMSRYRPHVDIVALTERLEVARSMNLVYGATGVYKAFPKGPFSFSKEIISFLKKEQLIKSGQTALVIHGEHWKAEGQTNALMIVHLA